jgi:hypothetical protein
VGEKNQRVLGRKSKKSRKNGKAEGKEEKNFRGFFKFRYR